jgi:peptidoglycan/xylan/chitin deacetylase (PgdA/CDA1 family)
MKQPVSFICKTFVVFIVSIASLLSLPSSAAALTQNPTPAAKVSFTFDDGYASALTNAAPTLAKYNIPATSYIITGCVGMTTVPNTCHANTGSPYMTWDQITQLQATYHWEIGSHTVNHYCLASRGGDCQATRLTAAQVTQELSQSKSDLAAHGFNATDIATPYGDYTNATLAQIAKYYSAHRGFADTGYNTHPYSDYIERDQQVQAGVSVATVKSYIDQAIANKTWLVLTMHDIKPIASTDPNDYEYNTADLDQIAAYVKSKQTAGLLQPITMNQGLVTSDTNILANPSFNDGIATGWSTDSPTTITKDIGNNGSFPDPTNSIKIVATAANKHLFSPKATVDPNTSYMLKNFINVTARTSGEVGFYIDEYDGSGNWISGQYKTGVAAVSVQELNFAYKPTSPAVAKASLQVIASGNSGITAYLDNSQWFPLVAQAPPIQTNLVANGSFDDGIADGWTTDNVANITKDSASNGSPENAINSIKLVSTTNNAHLFSPKVSVNSSKSYSLSSYANIQQMASGEVGFYIDEYDGSGNWISGQYKTGARNLGVNNVAFSYTPSSSNVAQASLQIIVIGNSNTLAYLDNVKWYQN